MTTRDPKPAAPLYRIGAVAHETGIATETLRIWERRYRVVVPSRTAAGGRLYSDGDLDRLRIIKDLVDHGHAISQVAHLNHQQLLTMQARLEMAGAAPSLDDLRGRFLDAASRLDAHTAQQILGRATLLLEPRVLVLDLIAPLLRELGERWAAGHAGVCHEHMASAIVRTVLGGLLVTQSGDGARPRIIAATPKGELHELGALLSAVLAGAAGWDVLYLGPNLPAEEIAEAAVASGARVVAISLVASGRRETEVDLRALVQALAPAVTLIAGGSGAAASAALGKRAILFADLSATDGWLRREVKRHAGE